MSKIICDVCGTSYPDTAPQCPICGYVNAGNQAVSGDTKEELPSKEYTHVKGGRFSKANVRKRNQSQSKAVNQAQPAVHNTTVEKTVKDSKNKDGKAPKGLIITAVVLLLAIIAVIIYISVRFFGPLGAGKDNATLPSESMESVDPSATSESVPDVIPCVALKLDTTSVTMDKAGASRMIYATVSPANTTDAITYKSSNPEVATVTANGKITVLAPGQAVITVTCGKITAECVVDSRVEATTEETAEATTEPVTEKPGEAIRLNRQDITFTTSGESWVLYSGDIGKTQITWTSDDPSIAKFEGGKVTAVGSGVTKVHAEYNGQKATCIIRCNFKDSSAVIPGNGGVSEDGGGSAAAGGAQIYTPMGARNDVTIKVGESIQFTLKDGNKEVSANWSLSGSGCTLSGGTVTGTAATGSRPCYLSATYNGKTYQCIVRVSG